MTASDWLWEFLDRRHLSQPDGRALYAYRCEHGEFDSLAELLKAARRYDNVFIRAFVLYAAEWWQRKYDGRHWAWEPLLRSIDWDVDYPDLYQLVREAWRWWRVDLVRLPSSIRYLGTFACQGGLPLALVGETDSRITKYLRAVLEHTGTYRKFGDDPIELARDKQHLLLPPTLRRDYVFRLAADLIAAVLDLHTDAQGEDPLGTLDRARPDWRETMPLDLGNTRAQGLLKGLLRDAAGDTASRGDDFRLDRFLRRTGTGWRLGARVRLPASIPADYLARQLKVRAADLRPRMEVRVQADRIRILGLYVEQADTYMLARDSERSFAELWDAEAATEVRIHFLAGDLDVPIVLYRGGALGDLPWVFRPVDGNECKFAGEGTVSNRAPELVALMPDTCTIRGDGTTLEKDTCVLDRAFCRIAERTIIETNAGTCVIRPATAQTAEEAYSFAGLRFYEFESTCPLFRGAPELLVAKPEQASRRVPANEVGWRRPGGDWRSRPDGYGPWEVRHVRKDELRFSQRIGILPAEFGLSLEPGLDMTEGRIVLRRTDGARVSDRDSDVAVLSERNGDAVRVHVRSANESLPPSRIRLRLNWPGTAELAVSARFPGRGGRFLRDGQPVTRGIAVDDLYGVRAIALSAEPFQSFWIDGELKALDLGDLVKVAHFRHPLRKSGVTHELALIDVRSIIELLLSASASSDARVKLNINYGGKYGSIEVSRFAASLEYDATMALITPDSPQDNETDMIYEALPLARPDDDPVRLDPVGPPNAPIGATPPQDMPLDEPWLVVGRIGETIRAHPIVVGARSDAQDRKADPYLREAIAITDPTSRTSAISSAMDVMLQDDDTDIVEENWAFLTDSLLRAPGVPPTALDLLTCLAKKPQLLVRCVLRLESAPRQVLWGLEERLPFSWLLVRRDHWWKEAQYAYRRVAEQLAGIENGDELALDYVCSILEEGATHYSALEVLRVDVNARLLEGQISDAFVQVLIDEVNKKSPEQIRLRTQLDDWPKGDGRKEWIGALGAAKLLNAMWQHEDEHRARQPIFDTPVAAAVCCFVSEPSPRTTFLVKRIRAHDSEWFDIAYSAAWATLAHKMDRLAQKEHRE